MRPDATGYAAPDTADAQGVLNAGTDYAYCKVWGAQVGSGSSYNHWCPRTDLDTVYRQERARRVRLRLLPVPLGQRRGEGRQRGGDPGLLTRRPPARPRARLPGAGAGPAQTSRSVYHGTVSPGRTYVSTSTNPWCAAKLSPSVSVSRTTVSISRAPSARAFARPWT